MYVCFILALGRTTVANVLVLSSLAPFASAIMGGLFLHERVPGRIWFAMTAAIAGIVLMFVDSMNSGALRRKFASRSSFRSRSRATSSSCARRTRTST